MERKTVRQAVTWGFLAAAVIDVLLQYVTRVFQDSASPTLLAVLNGALMIAASIALVLGLLFIALVAFPFLWRVLWK